MAIKVNLDLMMVKRGISLTDLAEKVGITLANLSILKNNKARALRFTTLEALCEALECQPGDLLEFVTRPDRTGQQVGERHGHRELQSPDHRACTQHNLLCSCLCHQQ